ncbi:hypothetical protein MN116_008335 [Schistosoma mekongi]|uniref:Uncharacterized protein n=1 Tax=Schistosoma mekongi TaxID=38744 RepID=A0AAE1Z7B1_SCHME|nr:hypothetical protein MN116_008335 [Schistosoma mekongi]
MYNDIIVNDDSERLIKVLSGPLSNSQIYQLAYSSIVNKSYSCMQCVLKHSQLDFYEPFEADGFFIPIIYHAIRLGNLDACKVLMKYGLNPLVCTGLCQLNNPEVICEDVVQFSFRFASNSYDKRAIALLFQTFLCKFITNLVEACKNGDYELIDQLLFSPNSLRIRCTIKNFANREFKHSTNFSSSPELSSNHFKYIHQPLTSLISNSFKSLKFNKYLFWSPGSSRDHHAEETQQHVHHQQQHRSLLELFSSEEILLWNSDESLNSHRLLSLTDLWEWARNQVKPLLLICVQNNYIHCMDKLLQVGFQVIPVSSTSERLELNRNFNNVNFNCPQSNNVLKPLVEDIRSVRKQLLWIESVYSTEDSAVHAAIRLDRIEAVKSIIRWDPDSLAITIAGNEMGMLPIHIACALNRLHCLQLILSVNNVPASSHFDSQHDANIESATNVKCCALFSCRIHESPGLYRHYYCIDQLDTYHLTAFLLAVIHEHVSVVRELLIFTVKAIKLTHHTELDDYRTDPNFNRDHHRLTFHNIDKFTYSNQFNNNDTINQQLSPLLDNNIDNVYADICPIDINRKISACWYFAVTTIHDDNNTNSYISADYNRPIIIINPRCHQSLDGYAVCGYFNALQLSIMTGNIELLSIMVDYLNREVNTCCTSCIHGQCYTQDNLKPSLQSIITSPLGLACCLAEADENKAVQVASILLNTGAVDINNHLFMYTMRKSFHKLAGLLFINETLKSVELNKSLIENNEVITKHLNLSNKSIQPPIISNSFWYLSPFMPQWIKLIEDALEFSDSKLSMLFPTSSSSSVSVSQSVVKENNYFSRELSKYISQLILSAPPPSFSIKFYNNISCQLITRITMSNCGLQTLPWCLFNCVTNLKELDLSKNHIRHLPRKLPNVPMAYREPQTISSCWSTSLIYLDLSDNYLEYLPTWLFVNQYEYEHGMMISSNGKPRNCQNNLTENYTHNVVASINTNDCIDSRYRRRCYSENAINTNNFSSLHHAPLMTDSFAPNLLHLLLSKNQLCTLPCEIWAGSSWCKLEFLDLSWNKISYLPFPNVLKVQFEHSRHMYKQSLYMKTQCLQETSQGQSISNTVQYPAFNSESILLPTDHILTSIMNHHQSIKNCNNNDNEIFERRSVHSFYPNGHTSHLTHLWLHHNFLKSLRLTNPTISNHSTIRTLSTRLPQNFSLAQICPNLAYLDASYNFIENFSDLFLCPERIVHIDLSYNRMKISDSQQQLEQHGPYNSPSSLSCQFGSSTSVLSINMGLYDKNTSNFLSHLLHRWNTDKLTRCSYFSKLEHLNLRGNQFHLFTCCANTLSNLSSEFKIFSRSQLFLSSLALSSSEVISSKQEHVLFPKLKSLDLGENPHLHCICPSLVYLTNLQYLSLDHCITLCELPGDLFRLPNLQSILLNKTPFVKYLLPSIVPNIKRDQIIDDNDFPDLSKKIYTQRILSCLKLVTDQPSPYTRFRIMVVGPTGVGKTTLVRLLKESATAKSSHESDLNRISIRTDQSPTSLSLFSSSPPPSMQSDINGNIPNHLLPLVQVTNLVITRRNSKTVESINYKIASDNKNVKDDFSETLSFDIWDVERNSITTNTLSTPDGNNNNNGSSIHTSLSVLDYPSEILMDSQLGMHCELTIYLALWRVSDGLLGLNRIAPWLMKIKSVSSKSPIILIGTHFNDCISNMNIYATQQTSNASSKYPTGNSLSNNISSINSSKFKSKFLQNSLKHHLKLMDQLVRSLFCTNRDLNAYGLPHLYSHMFLNLSLTNMSGKDSEVLMANIYDLCTLIHNAALSFKINNRTADILLPNISITPSSSHSFSKLLIPKLYHYAKIITEQLSIEMLSAQLPPIMEVNKFIFKLNKRLSELLPHPTRVWLPSILDNNRDVSIGLSPTSPLSSSSSSSSSLYITSCTHEFSTYSDIKGILLFLNQIGTILHFSCHKFLKNHIILSPVWLLNTLLKLIITLHNQQLFDMFMNSSLKTELMFNAVQHSELVRSLPNINRLLYHYNSNNDCKHIPKHDDSFHSMKHNSAVISSSYLEDFLKSFIRNTIITNDNTNPNAHMDFFNDVLLEDIFMCIFKQFDLIVAINHNDDCFKPDHDMKMKKTVKMKQFMLPSLLAARCFHPNLLHSYLEPAVIRYKVSHSSLSVSRYRPRYVHSQSKKESVKSNVHRTDIDCNNKKMIKNNHIFPQLCCWRVQTSTNKEIVRLYAVTYIPPGFWTQLNRRLLNDSSLHEICRRVYCLSKLPSELCKQLTSDYVHEDVSSGCDYDSCTNHDDNIGNSVSHHNNLKPEWTVWKRGMRLSLGHGQIGLARLQQLTLTNCALLRNRSLKQSFLNSSQKLSSPYSFSMNTDEPHSKLLQLQNFEEWDEPCAIAGEEVINKQNRKSLSNQCISNDDIFHFIEENKQHTSTLSNVNSDVYRSGIVETIKHSYEERCLRLMHWVQQQDKYEQKQLHSFMKLSNSLLITSMSTTRAAESPSLITTNKDETTKAASDFKLHSHGCLIDREHDAFQNSCLIEIYLPNLNIYWKYKQSKSPSNQTDKCSTIHSSGISYDPLKVDCQRNHNKFQEHCLSPKSTGNR